MNITLIGMPGSGKSFVGKQLAERLQFDFVETDALIEKQYNLPLQDVLTKMGDKAFLAKEEEVVITVTTNRNNIVLSPGGSIIYSERAMKHLGDISRIMYLDVPLTVIEKRIGGIPRGIVGSDARSLEVLYRERMPLYARWADHTLDGEQDAEVLVEEIIRSIK